MDDSGPSMPGSSMEKALSDFDLMDELLSGDCWLETPIYSQNLQLSPFLDTNIQQVVEKPNELEEQNLNWLIQPRASAVPLKDRLFQALRFIKESQSGSDVLVQMWVPMKRDGRNFLTTSGQPFWLDENSESLSIYRSVSTDYRFSTEENSNEIVGLPGRVFLGGVPEWTPDVRYFRRDEYLRVDHAQRYNVCGTIALPVFERYGKNCLGVVELVLTAQKFNYSSDLESICNALQAVDLRSSDDLTFPRVKVINNSYKAALPEIREALRAICETHSLPLAQTWMKCTQQGKRGSRHSNENIKNCVSTVDDACYIRDSSMKFFQGACSEYHLFKGQGVAGKAFTTNQPCFSPDVTSYTKTEYPLSHHAKLFKLRASVAIRLRSVHTGKADFVLEFFLPANCIGNEEQKMMLNSLSIMIQQVCKSLRVVSAREMEEDVMLESEDGNILSICNVPGSVPLEFNNEQIDEFGGNANWHFSDGVSPEGSIFSEFKSRDQSSSDQKESFAGGISNIQAGKAIEKRRAKSEKTVSLQVLRQYFAGSLKDAAKSLGVCPTTLKRICRQHGISRWPSRKIKKVSHSLKKLQVVIDSVQGAEGTFQFSSVYENFGNVSTSPNRRLQEDHTKFPESSNTIQQQEDVRINSHTSASNSVSSSSCSKSSDSSLGCSTHASQIVIKQEDEHHAPKLDRKNSDPELRFSRSLENTHELEKTRSNMFKAKAVFGEEKVRFRLQPNWGFRELKEEMMKRFNISDMISIDLKYLDDDSEWVLLTCDEDLQECVDVHKSCSGNTIKLSVHHAAQPMHRSSFSFPAQL